MHVRTVADNAEGYSTITIVHSDFTWCEEYIFQPLVLGLSDSQPGASSNEFSDIPLVQSPRSIASGKGSFYSDARRSPTWQENEELRLIMHPEAGPSDPGSAEATARRVINIDADPVSPIPMKKLE